MERNTPETPPNGLSVDDDAVDLHVPEVTAPQDTGRSGQRAHAARRVTLDREMLEIKDGVRRMGGLVEDQIRGALETLVKHDAAAATAIIAGDAAVNDAQRPIASLILSTIATQQPVARDLRFLLTLDHVTLELERMGDHAASIAKQARKLSLQPPLMAYTALTEMGALAADQVRAVVSALVDLDVAGARTVAAGDDEMDHLYHALFSEVVGLMRDDARNVDRGTRLLFAGYYLERIGDRVTNIAEDIVFLATGEVEDLNQ